MISGILFLSVSAILFPYKGRIQTYHERVAFLHGFAFALCITLASVCFVAARHP